MATEDFDIEALAAYLHLLPQQVSKMADRGKLPGRRIRGQWRFSQAEIHHWLEERIGASDQEELVAVEGVLERDVGPADEPVSVVERMPSEAVAIPLLSRTRSSVISDMVNLAASTGLLWDPEKMTEAVRARETLHPTALDNGVALLHPRRPMAGILAEPLLALGRTPQGIPFGGGALTDLFFLICSVDDRGHLRLLARLSRLLADPEVVPQLRAASDALSARQILENAEQRL